MILPIETWRFPWDLNGIILMTYHLSMSSCIIVAGPTSCLIHEYDLHKRELVFYHDGTQRQQGKLALYMMELYRILIMGVYWNGENGIYV